MEADTVAVTLTRNLTANLSEEAAVDTLKANHSAVDTPRASHSVDRNLTVMEVVSQLVSQAAASLSEVDMAAATPAETLEASRSAKLRRSHSEVASRHPSSHTKSHSSHTCHQRHKTTHPLQWHHPRPTEPRSKLLRLT